MDTARQDGTSATASKRIDAVDVARGAALVAMAVYHFTWDLSFFGFVAADTATTGPWKWFARAIASSFLFLVGVSVVLAHDHAIRWESFAKRMAQIVLAAGAITAGTYWFTPDSYVFFGILHHIAVASVVALVFLRLPALAIATVAVAVFAIGMAGGTESFNAPWFRWTGLGTVRPHSNDFVPVFPWFSAVLAGMAAWRLVQGSGASERLRAWRADGKAANGAAWLGRYSLAFYLLHQPLLIALVWTASQLAPPDQTAAQQAGFLNACQANCAPDRDVAFCEAYCGCFLEELEAGGDLERLFDNPDALKQSGRMDEIQRECSARIDSGGQAP